MGVKRRAAGGACPEPGGANPGPLAKARVAGSSVVDFLFYRGEVSKKSNDSVGISKSSKLRA